MKSHKEILGRGWAFPFRLDPASGGVALSEFEENIRHCISIVLGTRPGERQMLPNFGCRIHELLFAPTVDSVSLLAKTYVEEALRRWEPRIEVNDVLASVESSGALRVEVQYRIISTDAEQIHVHMVSNTDQR